MDNIEIEFIKINNDIDISSDSLVFILDENITLENACNYINNYPYELNLYKEEYDIEEELYDLENVLFIDDDIEKIDFKDEETIEIDPSIAYNYYSLDSLIDKIKYSILFRSNTKHVIIYNEIFKEVANTLKNKLDILVNNITKNRKEESNSFKMFKYNKALDYVTSLFKNDEENNVEIVFSKEINDYIYDYALNYSDNNKEIEKIEYYLSALNLKEYDLNKLIDKLIKIYPNGGYELKYVDNMINTNNKINEAIKICNEVIENLNIHNKARIKAIKYLIQIYSEIPGYENIELKEDYKILLEIYEKEENELIF